MLLGWIFKKRKKKTNLAFHCELRIYKLCKSKFYGFRVFIVNKLKRLCSPDAQTRLVFLLLRLSPNSDLLPALTVIGHCNLIGWLLGSWIVAHPKKNTNSQFGKRETFRRRWKRPLAAAIRGTLNIVLLGSNHRMHYFGQTCSLLFLFTVHEESENKKIKK